MNVRNAVVALLAGVVLSSLASSATIRTLEVSKHGGRYELVADTFLDAPADAIFAVLIDYDRFDRISSVYKESGFMEPAPDGTPIVYTRMAGCMLFYCMNMRLVSRLEMEEPKYIRATTLPDRSDFTYALAEWLLEPEASGTHLTYRLEMEPDFWVPPIIGPWVLKRTLRRGGGAAVQRIERLANGLPARVDGE